MDWTPGPRLLALDSRIGDGSSTQVPYVPSDQPGQWEEIATDIASSRGLSLAENARLFALLSLAQADAAVVAWEGKYRHNRWRPITAIQRADEDGNAETVADPGWDSLLEAPPFPEYPSGRSTFSKASATVIAIVLGTDAVSFDVRSEALPGQVRSLDSLAACVDEVGLSRSYGGIHFMSANRNGKASAAAIGDHVARNWLLPTDRLPTLWWEDDGFGSSRLRVHGRLGATCVVECSGELYDWSPLSTHTAVAGGFTLDVTPLSGHGVGFYRVREVE